MSSSTRRPSRHVATAAALCLALLGEATASAGELRAGFGSAPLPTPDGGPLAGYGGWRDRTATSLADPPEARALLLESGELRVALVAVDLVIIRPGLRAPLLEAAGERDIDLVALVATHTHSGPGGYMDGFLAERITAGSHRPGAAAEIVAAAVTALDRAQATLRPASTASGQGELDLADNRRYEDGPRETALPVLRIDRRGADSVVVFAYGMHATVRSPKSRAYSADFIGAARAALEAQGSEALFLPGPLGDQNPGDQDGPLWSGDPAREAEQAHAIGGRVADAVAATAKTLSVDRESRLAAREVWAELPALRVRRFCALWWLTPLAGRSMRAFMSERAPFQAIALGRARILALPAEPASAVGDRLRERVAGTRVPFVVAHANDWVGYVVSEDDYARGSYEACLSFHGPGLAGWLREGAELALDGVEEALGE